jgi:hypothetical protein
MNQTRRTDRQDVLAALTAARQRDRAAYLVGEIEGYCQQDGCNVRAFVVTIKEQLGPTPPVLCCPVCRHPATLHHVLTGDEVDAREDQDARSSVNAQLYQDWQNRTTPPGEWPALGMPVGVFLDETLPTIGRLEALERGEW